MTRESSKVTRTRIFWVLVWKGTAGCRVVMKIDPQPDVQYRSSDSTQRDIPPPYDCVPRYRVSFASEKFNEVSLTNRRMNMDRACINSSFFNPISRECLSLSAYHDVYPSTISGWRESVRESVRVAFPLVQYQRFRIHCPYLPIDSKRISLLPFLSSKWASSSMAVMIRL